MKNKLSQLLKLSLLALCVPLVGSLSACGGGETPETKNWTLTAKDGNEYSIVSRSSEIKFTDGVASVKDGTSFTFTLEYKKGYKADPAPTVKANDTLLTRNNDLSYLTVIKADTVISVTNVAKEEVKYDVTFTNGTGYEFKDVSVSLDEQGKASVLENTEVSFKVNILQGYEAPNLIVKANNKVLAAKNNTYTFTVTESTSITVSGVEKETVKHTVSFVNGTGFSYDDVSVALSEEGQALVKEGSEVTFIINFEKGYDEKTAVVKANDEVLSLNPEDEHYHAVINEDTTITVTNLKAKTFHIVMKDTSFYSFNEVSGITLTEGEGDIEYENEFTFKVNLSSGVKKGENFAVKFNDTEILPDEDVYLVKPDSDGEITVTGYVYSEIIVHEEVIDYAGTPSQDINTDAGYTKSTEYVGIWGQKRDIFETELAQYTDLRFSVKCLSGDYFEFTKEGLNLTDLAVNEPGIWHEYKFIKEELIDGEEVIGYKYQIYRDDVWTSFSLTEDGFLNEYQVMLGNAYGGADAKFLISELRGTKDPDYKTPTKEITFNEETSNHTLVVEGQTSAPYYGKLGEDFTFVVTPDEGYLSTVKYNGNVLTTTDNSYTIKIGKTNVIDITDNKLVNAFVFKNSVDNHDGTSSIESSWSMTQCAQFNDVTDLSSYSVLYFDFKVEQDGWFCFKKTNESKAGDIFIDSASWHTVTITVNSGATSINISISGITDTTYPIGGYNFDLDNNLLSSIGLAFHERTGQTDKATFTALFGEKI